MEWAKIILALIEILVWPSVVLILGFVLRAPITDLLRGLRRFRAAGFGSEINAEFSEGVAQVRALVATEILEGDTPVAVERSEHEQPVDTLSPLDLLKLEYDALRSIAAVEPRAAIVMAWTMIEKELDRLEDRAPSSGISNLSIHFNLPVRIHDGMIRLKHLRDLVAHRQPDAADISLHSAHEYIDTARDIISVLRLK